MRKKKKDTETMASAKVVFITWINITVAINMMLKHVYDTIHLSHILHVQTLNRFVVRFCVAL